MDDNDTVDLVLRINGNLSVGAYIALSSNIGRVSNATIDILNSRWPAGTEIDKKEVEWAINQELVLLDEAVRYRAEGQGHDNPDRLDVSIVENLFRACDPKSDDYDREFHRRLFREKPQFFGSDGLPAPMD